MVESVARHAHGLVLVALLSLFFAPVARAQDRVSVRVLDSVLAGTLSAALTASPTLRAIGRELEQSDLIVHVVDMPPVVRPRHAGMLQFVGVSPYRRFVRITVDARLPPDRRAEMLGHELCDAVEVSRARTVVDHESFAALYRRIGDSLDDQSAPCYDTRGAQRAGRRVLVEIRSLDGLRPADVTQPTGTMR